MKPISDRYKTDEVGIVPSDIKATLDELFWSARPNLHTPNPKILVVFSGTNGIGKSTIAHKIQTELQGLVLENDEVKKILIDKYPELSHRERSLLTWNYTMDLYPKISDLTPNGLIVRDGVIDWYFDRILPVFIEQGFTIFTIAFSVSKEKNIELIMKRGDTATVSTELLINQIDEHQVHIERFRKEYTPDVMLSDQNLFDHDFVLQILQEKINQLNKNT